jgi:hypothetical protein
MASKPGANEESEGERGVRWARFVSDCSEQRALPRSSLDLLSQVISLTLIIDETNAVFLGVWVAISLVFFPILVDGTSCFGMQAARFRL